MNSLNKYLSIASLALLASGALTSCQNDFDLPPLKAPEATMKPNTTIAQLKSEYWQSADNYYITLGQNSSNEDIIVHGRVISSDATGNIYKSLVIQDETGALAFSINQTGLNNNYRVGQEIVVNLTGLGFGKYAALQQVGGYGEYNGTPQVSFMDFNLFEEHTELNQFPNSKYVYVNPGEERPENGMYCIVADMGNLPTTPEGLQQYQSQFVVFRNVHFELGGQAPYSESDATTNRTLIDANGNSIIVRNSNYSSFRGETLPSGTGDVMGILSYYNGTWQLLLNSTADCHFESKGQKNDPYTVAEAIEAQGTGKTGWIEGYIVGSVKAGVTDIDSNDKIIWGADAEMDNTLVIGPSDDCKDYTKCVVAVLPQGSDFRKVGNLVDNPSNYGKYILVNGTFDSYLGTNGLLNNGGTSSDFEIEGASVPVDAVTAINQNFDASTSVPAGWTQAQLAGNKSWYVTTFNNNNYIAMTGYKGTAPFDQWLITPALNVNGMSEKVLNFDTQVNGYGATTSVFEVYVMTSPDPNTATLTKLNPALPTPPASGYSNWVNSGNLDLSSFSGIIYIGFRYAATTDANYATWCLDNVVAGTPSDVPDQPGTGGGSGDVTGAGSENEPYSVAYVMGTTSDEKGVWVEGYVVGWISGMVWATGANFNNTPSADYTDTNMILGPSADSNTITVTIPCAIPPGSLRDELGLAKNPDIYKKHVKVYGDIEKYFGQRGVKNITKYVIIED